MLDEVAAGYLLVRSAERSLALLPAEVLSASECVCTRFPSPSALAWVSASDEDRARELAAMGVADGQHRDAHAWATSEFGRSFGWPGVWYSLAAAREARDRFLSAEPNIVVLGIGLPRMWLDAFLAEATPPPTLSGCAPIGESGHLEVARRMVPLDPGGERLGFELLSLEHGQLNHSWLCNGLEAHCEASVGIRPGLAGLIEDLDSANVCRDEISRAAVGSEPGLWLPWLLVRYA